QAPLWRRLRDRLSLPSPAERLGDACAALRAGAAPLDLPARLSLFGLTRLPASYVEVLSALAHTRDVHLFLLHPSPALWSRVDAALDPGDRSLQIHACHGRARQVEVLRDAILHLLADDPTLEPRDVIVMCPDIETFAPLIHATFGAGDPDEEEDGAAPAPGTRPTDLRVRLADRSLRQTNPVLGVVAELIDLASARL